MRGATRRRVLLAGAAGVVLGAREVQAAQFISVLTGGTGGVYYPLGVAMAQLFNNDIAGAKATAQVTKGSVENLTLLQQGKGELAFSLGDSLLLGFKGDEEAGFKQPLTKLRGVAAIYPNYIQVVASRESGIESLADLKGKRLSVGAPKSGTELNARAILGAAGMTYDDLGRVEYLPFAESVELMKNRQLDATLQSAGLGVASIRDLAAGVPITVVAVPKELVEKVGAPYVPAVVPAGTYSGQDRDVPTATVQNYLVTHAGVTDDLVYAMTKAVFEHLDALAAAHVAAKEITLANALAGMPVPEHPGAGRYLREKGVG